MAKQNKVVSVLSTSAISGLVASALMTSQAFAAVDAYTVKVGGDVYQYSKTELMESYLDSTEGTKAPLFEDFQAKMTEGKGVFAYHDDKSGYVTAQSVFDKYLENEAKFNLDEFTASKDAKVTEVPTVKKAVVKDGEVKFEDQNNGEAEEGKVKVESVSAINLKQVKIEFASKVTDSDLKDDVEDPSNYTLEDSDKDELKDAVKKVKLDESKKFAILTFKDDVDKDNSNNYFIENQEKYTLTIDEDITGEEVKKELSFKDLELPKVEGVEVVGIDTIKVKFSEPIRPDNLDIIKGKDDVTPELDKEDFEVNGGDISINKVELVNDNTEANLILGSDFKDKQELSVKVKTNVRDYAGLAVVSETKKVVSEKDTKAPQVVGFKDAESNKVTLIFDKDIKFKDTTKNIIDNTGNPDLDKFYHTNDKNTAKSAKVDGKELTLEFDDCIPDGTAYIYVKSGVLESRWEIENDKISAKIQRDEDNERPELVKVEQDEDSNKKIKIKFSEKVKCDLDTKDHSATKTSNYTLEDSKGKEWNIRSIEKDGSSDKSFIINTTKELDDELKYKLTVENVEDKAGNAIKKVTKDFDVKDTSPVKEDDVHVTVYSPGTSDQKIVVDFDTKMTTNDNKYSIKDLEKYTLVSKDSKYFDDKDSINLSDLYKASIKVVKDGKAVEISVPCSHDEKNRKDKEYDLSKADIKSLQIARVSDANDNIITRNFAILNDGAKDSNFKIVNSGNDSIGYDTEPEVTSPDEIHFIIDDKVDFENKDIKVVAANSLEAATRAANGEKALDTDKTVDLTVSKWKTDTNKDVKTEVTMTLDKSLADKNYDDDDYDHILTYDGKFAVRNGDKGTDTKLDVYVVTVGTKAVGSGSDKVTSTKNDYDETLVKRAIKVTDSLAPAIFDNGNHITDNKLGEFDKNDDKKKNNDEVVEWYQAGKSEQAAIVLTFEEDIREDSISTSTFELDDDDFGDDAVVTKWYVKGNKVTLILDKVTEKIESGAQLIQKAPIKDLNDNEVTGLKLETGKFKQLDEEKVPELKAGPALEAATKAVEALEVAVEKDLKAEDNLTAANAAVTEATGKMKEITDAGLKARFELANSKVEAAKTAYAAEILKAAQEKVAALEEATKKPLTEETNLKDAEAAVTAAETALAKVDANVAEKADLVNRFDTEKGKVVEARKVFDATAEVNTELAKIDNTYTVPKLASGVYTDETKVAAVEKLINDKTDAKKIDTTKVKVSVAKKAGEDKFVVTITSNSVNTVFKTVEVTVTVATA